MLHLLLLLACSSGPSITGLDPAVARPGDTVHVVGAGFAEGAEAFLSVGPEAMPTAVDSTVVRGPTLLDVGLPKGTLPGAYTLGLKQGGRVTRAEGLLTVEAIPVDMPCSGRYRVNTQVSAARGEVAIDRFFRDGERETVRVKIADVERVEVERRPMPDGSLCGAIFLQTRDAGRVLFDDDAELDLKERAFKLGQTMGKRVEVVGALEPEAP